MEKSKKPFLFLSLLIALSWMIGNQLSLASSKEVTGVVKSVDKKNGTVSILSKGKEVQLNLKKVINKADLKPGKIMTLKVK